MTGRRRRAMTRAEREARTEETIYVAFWVLFCLALAGFAIWADLTGWFLR